MTTPSPTPAELEQAQAAATPRPWLVEPTRCVSGKIWRVMHDPTDEYNLGARFVVATVQGTEANDENNATLICHAVNLLPAHLAQIAAQAARIAELEAEVADLNIALVDWQTSDTVAHDNLKDAKAEIERLRALLARFATSAHEAVAGLDDNGRAHMVVACRLAPGRCFCGMHISQLDTLAQGASK